MKMNMSQVFYANDDASYESLRSILKEYLEGDCWALQVDSEYIFNSYLDNQRTLRENILEQILRSKIIEDPHSHLLVYLHRMGHDAEIRIHMFIDNSLIITIQYNAELKLYEIVL